MYTIDVYKQHGNKPMRTGARGHINEHGNEGQHQRIHKRGLASLKESEATPADVPVSLTPAPNTEPNHTTAEYPLFRIVLHSLAQALYLS